MKLLSAITAVLAWSSVSLGAAVTQTAVPIYLPYYEASFWEPVRGKIITKAPDATYYSIFCPPQTPPACDVALEFPFVFGEDATTLKFHGTLTSTFINTLECKLAGTTAATCTGYSSLAEGYTNGKHTGPTEIHWTSTLSGKDVAWGTLTLTDEPSTTDTLDITATVQTTDTTTDSGAAGASRTGSNGIPNQTGISGACHVRSPFALAWGIGAVAVAFFW